MTARDDREYGEDADRELMARADALPGRLTAETRGDVVVFTAVDDHGRTRVATVQLSAFDDGSAEPPPLVWRDVEAG